MLDKNTRRVLILFHNITIWVPTCAGDIQKKYTISSLRSLGIHNQDRGREGRSLGEVFVHKKAKHLASGCSVSIE